MGDEDGIKRIEITIQGMHCRGCIGTLQSELESMNGVERAAVSLEGATIEFQQYLISREEIEQQIEASGYQVVQVDTDKKKRTGFINRMIESNKKNFGNKRLDCCDLN